MKIYLASAAVNVSHVRALAQLLRAKRFDVVSTWHEQPDIDLRRASEGTLSHVERAGIAAQCMREILSCDEVGAIEHPSMRGALWECGYATGLGKPVRWLGSGEVSLFASICLDWDFNACRV